MIQISKNDVIYLVLLELNLTYLNILQREAFSKVAYLMMLRWVKYPQLTQVYQNQRRKILHHLTVMMTIWTTLEDHHLSAMIGKNLRR